MVILNDDAIQKFEKPMAEEAIGFDNIIETKEELQKLTEEEKQKVIYVLDDFFSESSDESSDSEYITEYDILMEQKNEEFKNFLLEDNTPEQIEALLELCDKYIKERKETKEYPLTAFAFTIMYDMWLNKSGIWPVPFNPEWENWKKLRDKKVKRKKDG